MKRKRKLLIRNRVFLFLLMLSTVLTSTKAAYAQNRWGISLKGGVDFATAKLANTD